MRLTVQMFLNKGETCCKVQWGDLSSKKLAKVTKNVIFFKLKTFKKKLDLFSRKIISERYLNYKVINCALTRAVLFRYTTAFWVKWKWEYRFRRKFRRQAAVNYLKVKKPAQVNTNQKQIKLYVYHKIMSFIKIYFWSLKFLHKNVMWQLSFFGWLRLNTSEIFVHRISVTLNGMTLFHQFSWYLLASCEMHH